MRPLTRSLLSRIIISPIALLMVSILSNSLIVMALVGILVPTPSPPRKESNWPLVLWLLERTQRQSPSRALLFFIIKQQSGKSTTKKRLPTRTGFSHLLMIPSGILFLRASLLIVSVLLHTTEPVSLLLPSSHIKLSCSPSPSTMVLSLT